MWLFIAEYYSSFVKYIFSDTTQIWGIKLSSHSDINLLRQISSILPEEAGQWPRQGFQDLEADAAGFSLISKSAALLWWPGALVLGGPVPLCLSMFL